MSEAQNYFFSVDLNKVFILQYIKKESLGRLRSCGKENIE